MGCPSCGNMYTTSRYTCHRCNTRPAPLFPPQPSPLRTPKYDNVAMLEGFALGILAAWAAATLGLVAAVLAFFATWAAFVALFMFFPIPVTVLATVAWAVLTGAITGWLTENNWLLMVGAGGLAALVSVGAHMRAFSVLRVDAGEES